MSADTSTGGELLDIHSSGFSAEMHERLRVLRTGCPVAHSDAMGGFWAVTRYEDVVAVARHTEVFSSSNGVTLPRVGHLYDPIPLEADPPEHARYRRILQPLFSRASVQQFEAPLREFVRGCVDAVADSGAADLVQAIGERVPMAALSLVLGIDDADRPRIRELTESLLGASSAGRRDDAAEIGRQFFAFLAEQLADRQGDSHLGGALAIVANAEVNDRPLTDEEKLGMAYLLIVAGHHTTVHAIGSALAVLAGDRGLRSRLAADPTLIPAFVEESLRWETSVPCMARTALHDTTIGEQAISEGERLMLFFTSANHDDERFPAADRFDVDRESNQHLTFGFGAHRCQGEHVARLELNLVVEELLARIPDFELAPGETLRWKPGYGRGLESLPVVWG